MTHYPASRFAVRQPAPDYRPAQRWGTALLFALIVLLILLGATVEGRAQETATVEHPSSLHPGITTLDPSHLSPTVPEYLTIAAGTGLIKISFKTGKVEVVGVTLDEASRQFWVSVAKESPEFRDSMQRKYTINEIDELRRACWTRCAFGTTYFATEPHDPARELKDKEGKVCGYAPIVHTSGRSFSPGELDKITEEQVRTAMLAGLTAKDIYEADTPKETKP